MLVLPGSQLKRYRMQTVGFPDFGKASDKPDGADVSIDGTEELAEVRWVSPAQAEELMGDMFGPARQHLQETLGG